MPVKLYAFHLQAGNQETSITDSKSGPDSRSKFDAVQNEASSKYKIPAGVQVSLPKQKPVKLNQPKKETKPPG